MTNDNFFPDLSFSRGSLALGNETVDRGRSEKISHARRIWNNAKDDYVLASSFGERINTLFYEAMSLRLRNTFEISPKYFLYKAVRFLFSFMSIINCFISLLLNSFN